MSLSASVQTRDNSSNRDTPTTSQKEVYLNSFIDFITNEVLKVASKRSKENSENPFLDIDSIALVKKAKQAAWDSWNKTQGSLKF